MAIANVALTNTFDDWRTRTNQLIYQSNFYEGAVPDLYLRSNNINVNVSSAFAKVNVVAISANTFAANTIAGANIAVGLGANSYANVVWSRSNTYMTSTVAGANAAVGLGANAFASATISGANSAVGLGANAFASATVSGANSAVGLGANAFASATIAGANAAVGAGANSRSLINSTATISGTLTSTGSFIASKFSARDDSAAAPGHTFVNDPYMGMYRVAANTLALSTSSNTRFSINATGRIVGAGSPTSNGFNGTGDRYISASTPSGGADGDIWYKV